MRPPFPAAALAASLVLTACGANDADPGTAADTVAVADTTPDTTGALEDSGAQVDANTAAATDANANADASTCPVEGAPCDDGDGCTQNDRCAAGLCKPGIDLCECQKDGDCQALGDGNPCNGVLVCDTNKHKCGLNPESVVYCDIGNDTVCATNKCNAKTGKCAVVPTPVGTPCVDDDPCTVDSACQDGACAAKGNANVCGCAKTGDCAALSAKDKCVGTWYCELSVFPWQCKLNPATAVKCDAAKATPCKLSACDPDTGGCALIPVKDGTPCDDGDAKTLGDACAKGQCQGGSKLYLCSSNADCDALEDGDYCNGVLFCDKGDKQCKLNPATKISCPTVGDTGCRRNTCDPGSGACLPKALKNGTPCDDGDSCTAGDLCLVGQCKTGPKFVCPCKTDADCLDKDDGDRCNGISVCDTASKTCQFNAGSIVTCPSLNDSACQKNACWPASGTCHMTPAGEVRLRCDPPESGSQAPGGGPQCRKVLKPATEATVTQLACSDGDACTVGDVCVGATCKPGADSCPCKSHKDCLSEDDGDQCNGIPICNAQSGKCEKDKLTKKVFCIGTDDTACATNRCDPADGQCKLTAVADGTACDDDHPCTAGESCKAGKCGGGQQNTCDDGDPCTQDSCDPNDGCEHPPACGDGNACTADACDAKTGKCAFSAGPLHGKVCDADQNGCTINDACNAGTCKAGAAIECSVPLKPCQVAACVATGPKTFICAAKPAPDGTACDDGDPCRVGEACKLDGAGQSKCQKGTGYRLGHALIEHPKGGLRLYGGVAMPDGGAIVVGVIAVEAPDKATHTSWGVYRLNLAGEVVASQQPYPSAGTASVAHAVARATDGSVAVAGASPIADSGANVGRLLVYAASFSSVKAKITVADKGSDLRAVVAHKGGWAVAGRIDAATGGIARLYRYSAGGNLLGTWSRPGGDDTGFAAMTSRPDGQLVAVGALRSGSGALGGLLIRYNPVAAGVELQASQHKEKVDQQYTAVAFTGSGYLVGGTTGVPGGASWPWVQRVDAKGNPAWSRQWSNTGVTRGVIAMPGGGTLVAARRGDQGDLKAWSWWLRSYGPTGALVWEDSYKPAAFAHLGAMIELAGGNIAVVGSGITKSKVHAAVMRLDAWGHDSCGEAGTCANKKAKDCDDGNACTDDFCEAGTGCINSANTAACDDDNACTTADVCTSNKCKGGALRICDDGKPCTADSCDAKLGCLFKQLDIGCDDGDKCTTKDRCLVSGCKGEAVDCEDGNPCTFHGCNKLTGCQEVKGAAAQLCDDKDPCTKDTCDANAKDIKAACAHTAIVGLPCDDGDACTVLDACAVGGCKAGQPKLWGQPHAIEPKANTIPLAVRELPDGDIVMSGWYGVGGGPAGYTGWALRYTAAGVSRCQALIKAGSGDASQVVATFADGDGMMTVGSLFVATGGIRPRIVALDKDCKAVADVLGNTWGRVTAAAQTGRGDTFITGADGNNQSILAARLLPGRKWAWQRTYDLGALEGGRAVLPTDDGGAVIAAFSATASYQQIHSQLLWLDSAGRMVRRTRVPGTNDASVQRLAWQGDELLLASATQGTGAAKRAVLSRLDRAGGALTTLSLTESKAGANGSVWGAGAVPLGGGLVAVALGWTTGAPAAGGAVVAVDKQGKTRWRVDLDVGADDYLTAIAPTADGGLVAVGRQWTPDRSASLARIERLDGWGHRSCAGAGKCAQATAKQCDDGNSCTLDLCAAAKGCVNTEATLACDDGNSCTAAGRCKDGSCTAGAPRLYETQYGGDWHDEGIGLVQQGGGRLLVIGGRHVAKPDGKPSKSPRTELRTVDAAGITVATAALAPSASVVSGGAYEQWLGSVATTDDGLWMTHRVTAPATSPALEWSHHGRDGVVFARGFYKSGLPQLGGSTICGQRDGGALLFAAWSKVPRAAQIAAVSGKQSGLATLSGGAAESVSACAQNGATTLAVGYTLASSYIGLAWLVAPVAGDSVKEVQGYRTISGAKGSVSALYGVAARPDGGWLAVGRTSAGQTSNAFHGGWLVWLGSKAEVQRQLTLGSSQHEKLTSARLHPDGGWLVTGRSTAVASSSKEGAQALLMRISDNGSVLWQRGYGGEGHDVFNTSAIVGGGSLALLGTTGGDPRNILLVRTDAWGESDCPKSGACASKVASGCDDGDPCTLDRCQASAGGCLHELRQDLCAAAPACRPDQDFRAFAITDENAGGSELFDVIASGPRTALAVGDQVAKDGKRDGLLTAHNDHGEQLWERIVGGAGEDRLFGIARQRDGHVAAGWTDSVDYGGAGGRDGWLQAFGANGASRWTRTYGGAADDELHAVAATGDGVVAVGRTKTKAAGSWDGWLVATDARGEGRLDVRLGGAAWDELRDVAAALSDRFAAVGRTRSTGPAGYNGWLVIVHAATGARLQGHTFGLGKDDGLDAIAAVHRAPTRDTKTGALVAGAFNGYIAAGQRGDVGFGDAWLLRVNANGEKLWERTYGGKAFADAATDVVVTRAGFAIAGRTLSHGSGKTDPWLLATTATGALRFHRTQGGPGDEWSNAVAAAPGGGFWLAGGGGAPKARARLVKTTGWGYAQCEDLDGKGKLGVCGASVDGACGDGSACTVDACERHDNKGCSHTALTGDDKPAVCMPLNTREQAERSCLEQLRAHPDSPSGSYWINATGGSTADAFPAGCDMVTDGGGWTLVMALDKNTSTKWQLDQQPGANPADVARDLLKVPAFHRAIDKKLVQALGDSGASAYLVDIGRGLYRVDVHQRQGFDWYRGLWDTDYYSPRVRVWRALGNKAHAGDTTPAVHAPAGVAGWRMDPRKPKRFGVGKCPGSGCLYVPGMSLFESAHRHVPGATGAGGLADSSPEFRHYSKVYVR